MLYNENLKLIEEIKNHIPTDSKILGSEIITQYNSLFVRVSYEVSTEYQKENDLIYRKRYFDVLLMPSKEYEGAAITSHANNN